MSETKENISVNSANSAKSANLSSEPKENSRSKEKLSVNEAMNEYYKLKSKYETDYQEKYIKPILKANDKSKREKRLEYQKLPKAECINCRRNVGSIFTIKKDEIHIKGYLAPVNLLKSTLLKHFFLRILSFFFRSKLINILKNVIIFRKFDLNKKYNRKIIFFPNKIVIIDYFENLESFTLFPNFKNNLRHVASANVFSNEDFSENLFNKKKNINKKYFIIKKIIKL
jgi:hypothetical protein